MKQRSLTFYISIAAVIFVLIGAGIIAATHYFNSPQRGTPEVFSNNALLLELWNDYKAENIEASSYRTLDKTQNNITTSEGQSYSMLRAVWMDDRDSFDQSWQFTKNNLQRDDYLMSWKFGQKSDGSFGVLDEIGGNNTATDGDTDIALALMMAYSRWNSPDYLYQAKQIINSVWDKEVVSIQGRPVLVANDIERNSQTTVVVNPSYFSPYAYKLFAKVDPRHDWESLVDSSYDILNRVGDANLDKDSSTGLPPNWITINRQTGEFIPNATPNLDTNYGYDAFRTPWRLALDHIWFKDERAKTTLAKYSFLSDQFNQTGQLKTVYSHDGQVIDDYESPAMYGTAIGYFKIIDPATGNRLYERKLASLYDPDRQEWKTDLAYYNDNWAWFGIAMQLDALPNLAEEIN